MKKVIGVIVACLFVFSAYSKSYKITDCKYNVTGNFWGTTKENSLRTNYPIENKKIFSEEEFQVYIENYTKKLESTRLFYSVDLEQTYSDSYFDEQINDEIQSVSITISLVDSSHFLVVPYPKYSSNDGFTLKLKAKDTNFLGSMNTMNSELTLNIDNGKFIPGLSFSYNHPFTVGENTLSFVNDHSISYTIGNSMPDLSFKTGISFVKPYDRYSYNLSVLQYFNYDNNQKNYNDAFYMTEEISISTPIMVRKLKNYTNLTYTPFINLKYNWDFDGINIENSSLRGPGLSFGQSLSNSNVKWDGNFRKGYSINLENNYSYNFSNADFAPSLSFEASLFTHFKPFKTNIFDSFGLYTHLYGFTYIDLLGNHFPQGDSIGSYLRGRLDGSELGFPGRNIASTGAVINIDIPVHIFTTNFKKDLFNFELQASPFIDIGVYSKGNSIKPSLHDSIFCAGGEILVFPKKFSSFIIRASLGIDVLKALKDDSGIVRGVLNNKEIYIGLGTAF